MEKPVYGKDDPSFTNFMAPGIALSVIFFLSVASTASNYVLERQLGLIERSYLAGVKTIELLLSQLIIYTIIMLIQIVIVMCLLFFFLKRVLVLNSRLDHSSGRSLELPSMHLLNRCNTAPRNKCAAEIKVVVACTLMCNVYFDSRLYDALNLSMRTQRLVS